MKTNLRIDCVAAALLAGCVSWPVHAGEEQTKVVAFSGAAVSTELLAAQRGGTADVQINNESLLQGSVRDNRAVNVQTGSNLIGGDSFAGASGLITALQNSGNNVLFQNSTIVNVQVR